MRLKHRLARTISLTCLVLAIGLVLIYTNGSRAASGVTDPTFNPGGAGANDGVISIAVQTDGKIIIGGLFTAYNGDTTISARLMRLNADGTRDVTFNPGGVGANNRIGVVKLQPDGKILIGGSFTSYNSDLTIPARIMRLNADGTRDLTFNLTGTGADSAVGDIALQPDGKIVIGGSFTSYNGDAAAPDCLLRLNADGTLDTSFNAGGSGAGGPVTLALQPDGKILIAGSFTSYNGDAATPDFIARVNADGTRDASFNAGGVGAQESASGGGVYSIALLTSGKIVIGGYFNSYNAAPAYIFMRLNANGTADPTFNAGGSGFCCSHGLGSHPYIGQIAVDADGRLVVWGDIGGYNTNPFVEYLTRINADGTQDLTFNPGGVGTGPEFATVLAIALQADAKILIGGYFSSYNNDPTTPDRIMRLLSSPNAPPVLKPDSPFTRQQGNPVGNSEIAKVNDPEDGPDRVIVALTSANPANGVTVSNIVNNHGVVTADVVASCNATNASFTLTATDSNGATTTATLIVTVNANTPPTLTYATPQTVILAGSLNVMPTTAADNGSFTYSLLSVTPALSTVPTVNSTGVVAISNAQPAGSHVITVRATDNCGATTDASFTLNVNSRPLIKFSSPTYSVNENGKFVTITVNRSGDLTPPVNVDYATPDDSGSMTVLPCSTANGVASPRCDFTTTLGTLRFAANETNKTFVVLISQDSFVEGNETLTLTLSNPTGGAGFAQPSDASATLTIVDDDTSPLSVNPIDDATNFVRQHYHDFLNREADDSGLQFWTGQITSCGTDPQCIDVHRVNVSAAFFLSIEFQQTGYLVERFYKVAYGDAVGNSSFQFPHQLAVPKVRFNEFLRDTFRIGQGVVVLQPGWQQALENNKQAYALEFVQTSRFVNALPTTLRPDQFVDRLNQNAGGVLNLSDRDAVISLFHGAADTTDVNARAQAVRQVADNQALYNAEFNRAFVLVQYFGYLRRNPDDAPEVTHDYTGYDFWLNKLSVAQSDYIDSEMVKAFLTATEYRQRFGP